jgi:hypothetical protein
MVRAAVVLAMLMATGTAAARPARLVTSGDGCDTSGLATRIATLVEADPFTASASAAVFVEIDIENERLVARISLDSGDGHPRGPRIVTAESCGELLEAVALVVAMALPEFDAQPDSATPSDADAATWPSPTIDARNEETDPMSPSPTTEAREERNASSPSPTEESGSIDDLQPDPVRPRGTDIFVAGAGGLAGQGVRGQLLLGARWQRASRSWGVELRADTPESRDVGTMDRIDVWRTQVTASRCVHVGGFGGCALASLGTIYGSGVGLTNGRRAFTPLVAGGVRLMWRRELTARFALQLHMDLTTLLTRTEFDVDQMPAWTSDRFEGSIGAGIVARFL